MPRKRFPPPWSPPPDAERCWTAPTMTSLNYAYVRGDRFHYGVDSVDDEQAFAASCALVAFARSEAEWWVAANFPAHELGAIRDFVERSLPRFRVDDA